MSAFGSGSNSNGNFWYGNSTNFPGFLYKKNLGVGGRRSTKMGPGGNITCNNSTYLYNKYKPGGGGVGASSVANRRAKNRLATVCSGNKCFPCYTTLGQYSNYTHNPNGFIPCPVPLPPRPPQPSECVIRMVSGNVPANMDETGLTECLVNVDDDFQDLDFTGLDYYFYGTNYGNGAGNIYFSSNWAFGFGPGNDDYSGWNPENPAILFDFYDNYTTSCYYSGVLLGASGSKYLRVLMNGTPLEESFAKKYEIIYARDSCFQYMQFNCFQNDVPNADHTNTDRFNIANGSSFDDIFGTFITVGPQTGGSYVVRSNISGNNWEFFPNYHLVL
jgi:hypothetical protein